MPVMASQEFFLLIDVPPYLIKQCELYAVARGSDAVLQVLSAYPSLVADYRKQQRKLADFDAESLDFDRRLADLQAACKRILDL